MSDIRENIARAGRAIRILCLIMQVICAVLLVLGVVGLVLLLFGSSWAAPFVALADNSSFVQLVNDSSLVQLVDDFVDVDKTPILNDGHADLAFFILFQAILLVFFVELRQFVRDFSLDDHPFKVETARRIRRRAWSLALLMLWNALGGIMITLIAFLASYLIEYGAYLQEKADETERIQEDVIISLVEITENKSGQTGQHVRRVAEYTRVLAEELGYPADRLDEVRLASTMHDIGKLLVPDEILEKPGPLTDEEFEIVKQHTTNGGKLLEGVGGDVMRLSRVIALDHHERWDGEGYAQGKAGEDISLEGRIVAVADFYDALTSNRCYKDAWDGRAAYDEIVRSAGAQFDPQVVEAFCRRYDDIDAIRRKFADD